MDKLIDVKVDDDWKRDLRSKLIIATAEATQEKLNIYSQIGYYYECYAPATIFKYYPDKPERLADVKANKMWYSAPCTFNDVFDCDIAIDEKEIFNSVLLMCPDKRGIRAGSSKWKELKSTMRQAIKSFRSEWETLRTQTGIACKLAHNCRSRQPSSKFLSAGIRKNICLRYHNGELNTAHIFHADTPADRKKWIVDE